MSTMLAYQVWVEYLEPSVACFCTGGSCFFTHRPHSGYEHPV